MRFPQQGKIAGVNGVSFSMKKGEIIAIVGESGSGKTTLLKSIYGLYDLQKGEVHFEKEPVYGPSRNLIPGHKRMKLVSQQFDLKLNQTVFENVEMCLYLYFKGERHERVNQLLKWCKLDKEKYKKGHDLSGGQQQRLAIARALAEQPDLILMDEPFSNLDGHMKEMISLEIKSLVKQERMSCIIVTHDATEAMKMADRIFVFYKGKIIQRGLPEEIYLRPKNQYVSDLFGWGNWIPSKLIQPEKENELLFFRPEQLSINNKKGIPATWKEEQFEGFGYLQMFEHNEQQIAVRTQKSIREIEEPYFIAPKQSQS